MTFVYSAEKCGQNWTSRKMIGLSFLVFQVFQLLILTLFLAWKTKPLVFFGDLVRLGWPLEIRILFFLPGHVGLVLMGALDPHERAGPRFQGTLIGQRVLKIYEFKMFVFKDFFETVCFYDLLSGSQSAPCTYWVCVCLIIYLLH